MPNEIPQGAYPLFDEPTFAHVTTLLPDGMPQNTPVWIDREGNTVLFNTARGRAKAENLERDPRVALSITDPQNPYGYVQVRGRAELVDEGADAHIDKLAKKYLGVDEYPFRQPGEQRVIVRITPEAVQYTPPPPG